MSARATWLIAVLAAVLIVAAGVTFALTRTGDYRSTATILLAPKADTDPDTLSTLLDSFGRSGTSGTYVQLISSPDTLERTGYRGVGVEVTPVPDSRTIEIETTGSQEVVQPALEAVIRAAQEREQELGDVWRLQVLGSPSEPEPAGVTTAQLVGATVLLALLGALFVIVVLRRYRQLGGAASPAAALAGIVGTESSPELEEPAQVRVGFELESFRFVKASPTTALLQVTGYWRSDHPRALAAPTLELHEDDRVHPIAPLSTPDSRAPEAGHETPLWRGSYAAPLEIVERHDRIALRAGDVAIGLPSPSEQSLLAAAGRTNGGAPEHEHEADDERAEHDAEADAVEEDERPA